MRRGAFLLEEYMSNPFKKLTKFEVVLWLSSIAVITLSTVFSGNEGWLSTTASLIGVTALIFVAKGMVIGQVLTIVFAVFYGIISMLFSYYGEVITYLGMTAPMALLSVISWIRNPYGNSGEVKVAKGLTKRQWIWGFVGTLASTVILYFVLKALGNASLTVSTLSVTTSFVASYFTFCRSPYYALAYSANDIVLIVLWIIAALKDISCLSMIFCFIMFFLNDIYGFYNWKRMEKNQSTDR